MQLTECMQHDLYCVGHKQVKLCNMCYHKEVNEYLNSLPIDQNVEIKEGMRMIDAHTCKVTNISFYKSKRTQ